MTGAGVSAASGIPTFRGADGFYSKTVDDETGLVQYYFNFQRILRRL
jgi:NAD-dependent SIR2 family protein deacetylase